MKKIKKIAKKRNKRIIKKAKKNVSKFPKAKVILRFAALPQATDKFIKVGNRLIGHDQPVFITAEIGINHNGDLALAKQLINAAVTAGCDAVKFQKRTVPVIYSPEELAKPREVNKEILRNAVARGVLSPEATARLKTSNFENSVNGDLKWALEFTKDEYDEIARYARDKNIIWFASCWDEEAVDFMREFDIPVYKIASASLTDHNLLRHTRAVGKPIILSTGMSDLALVKKAVATLKKDNLGLMHSVSTYPTEPEHINLLSIHTLHNEFGLPTGYSGHEVGISPSFAAAVLGACMIERHITIDRAMPGSDKAVSVEPQGMKILVDYIRLWEKAKGDGVKKIHEAELPVIAKLRRK